MLSPQQKPKLELNFSQNDNMQKATRLSDIKRGADLTKVVNELAEQQWRGGGSVMPRIMETEESVTPKRDLSKFRCDEPQLLQTSTPIKPMKPTRATPLKPISRAKYSESSIGTVSREIRNIPSSRSSWMSSIFQSGTEFTEPKKPIRNLKNVTKTDNSGIIVHRKPSILPELTGLRDPKSSIDLEELYYNTWGSRDLGMDYKLIPEQVPQYKAPKKSIPTSRVANKDKERQLKTKTDFRSRNGTVKIVNPPKPLPPIAQFQYPNTDLVEDVEDIEREKTFVTLRRIDQILNPQQAYLKTELNSSEFEILGSGSSTPVSVKEGRAGMKETVKPKNDRQRKKSFGSYVNHSGGLTVIQTYPSFLNKVPKTVPQTKKEADTFAPLLKTLECEKLTSYEKCTKWIDKCSEWH